MRSNRNFGHGTSVLKQGLGWTGAVCLAVTFSLTALTSTGIGATARAQTEEEEMAVSGVSADAQRSTQPESKGSINPPTNSLPSSLDELKEVASDFYLHKHFHRALPAYQKIVELLQQNKVRGPELTTAQDNLADALCQTGQFARARAIYEAHLKALGVETSQVLKQDKKDDRTERKLERKSERRIERKTEHDKTKAGQVKQPEAINTVDSEVDEGPAESRSNRNDADARKKLFYLTEIAATYFRDDSFSEAERYLATAVNMAGEAHLVGDEKFNNATLLSIYMGETFYKQGRFEEAVKTFKSALESVQNVKNVSYEISKTLLGSLAGSYDSLKQYDKAVPIYRTMALLDRTYFGDTDINYGWSLLELSDALKASGHPKEAQPLYEKAVWIFRDHNYQRLAEKYHIGPDDLRKEKQAGVAPEKLAADVALAATLRQNVFGLGLNPAYEHGDKDLVPAGAEIENGFDHCQAPRRGMLGAWNVRPDKHMESPGWVWTDPTVKQKAVMLCVHGLGLHHRAFESFAERIIGQGFTVVSFDVRGFGAYVQSKGHDHLDMKACVQDLESVIALMRRDYSDRRIFLLGESMGGALALRVAADKPDLIDGLVCSVPAAERHHEYGTKFKVALKLFTDSKKTINLEKTVVDKSVNDDRERAEWRGDPKARLKLSPRELVAFELFMRQNRSYAAKVTHTPVLVFQGTNDRLVKESGTENLFRALTTKDKALVLMGNQEHLIFEANPYKDDLTMGIIGWLDAHADEQSGRADTATKIKKTD